MAYNILTIQRALKAKGFNPGPLDGKLGAKTNRAIIAFKRSVGLRPRSKIGPITYAKLTGDASRVEVPTQTPFPWYNELLSILGKHESRDNAFLKQWLASDGATVGDPAKIPWCGDGVQTAILRTLPTEPMPDNPYLAANWAKWGNFVKPQLGCSLSFWRGSPRSWKGHIGLYAGESRDSFYVLGTNQEDSVSIVPLSKKRLRKHASRWPTTTDIQPRGIRRTMTGGVLSTNEA